MNIDIKHHVINDEPGLYMGYYRRNDKWDLLGLVSDEYIENVQSDESRQLLLDDYEKNKFMGALASGMSGLSLADMLSTDYIFIPLQTAIMVNHTYTKD